MIVSCMFFATPLGAISSANRGSQYVGGLAARLATAAGFLDGSGVVEVLKAGEIFSDLRREHWNYQLSNYSVISFWGDSDDIVRDDSVRLSLPTNRETLIKLEANHHNICNVGISETDTPSTERVWSLINLALSKETIQQRDKQQPPIQTNFAKVTGTQYYIPLPRNDRFTGRETVLNELHNWINNQNEQSSTTKCHIHWLIGPKGVGKTQVAVEFAYLVKNEYPEYSIFCIDGQDENYTLANIAEQLYDEIDDREADLETQVRKYLESKASRKWLLIIDNWNNSHDRRWYQFTRFGHSLTIGIGTQPAAEIESTDRKTVLRAMSPPEATLLFNALVRESSPDQEMTRGLLKELGYFPLAIAQAAAHLNQNRVSLVKYRGLLPKADEDLVDLITQGFRLSTQAEYSGNALANILIISLTKIKRSDRGAVELLEFLSCIESTPIPQSILPGVQSEEAKKAIDKLCRYGFLIKGKYDTFYMHGLLHRATRIWVTNSGCNHGYMLKALRHLRDILQSNDATSPRSWKGFFPHVLHALKYSAKSQAENMRECRYALLCQLGYCLVTDRSFRTSVEALDTAYRLGKGLNLHPDDICQIQIEYLLSAAYLNRIDRVQKLERVVTVIEGSTYDQFDLPAMKQQLGMEYKHRGRIKEAIKLFEWTGNAYKIKAENDYLRVMAQINLIEAYLADNRDADAINIIEIVLPFCKNMPKEEEVRVLKLRHELAKNRLNNGRIKEAIEILQYVVDHKKCPEESRYDLARAYLGDGQRKAAIAILKDLINAGCRKSEYIELLTEQFRPKRSHPIESVQPT